MVLYKLVILILRKGVLCQAYTEKVNRTGWGGHFLFAERIISW